MSQYFEVREGTANEYEVVWQNGNDIPAASAEMEAYYELFEQINAIALSETPDGKAVARSREDEQRLKALYWALEEAREAVPEWK